MIDDEIPDGRIGLFGTLCGLVFLVNLARIVFAPLVEPLRAEFVLTVGQGGLIATMAWVGSALPRLPTGWLLTRVPRHRVVLATGVVLTAASAFTATASTPILVYAGALTMGLASGAYFIAANPLISELFPRRVGRAIGIHGMAAQVSAAGASVFVGVVLAVGTWQWVFWIMSAAAALVTVALYVASRRADMPTAGDRDRAFFRAARRQWPIIVTGIAIIGATGFVWNGLFNLYVTYLVETKPVTEATARNLLTVVFAAGIPAFLVTGRLADRFPHVPLMLSILAGFIGCLLALTVLQGWVALVAISVAIGYVAHSLFPAIDTYMLSSLPDENRASAYAVFSAVMMLVQSSGSYVLGTLRDLGLSFDLVFRTYAAALAVVLAVLLALYLVDVLPSTARSPA